MSNTKMPSRCSHVTRCKNTFFQYNDQTFMPFFNRNRENRTKNMPFITKSKHFDYKNPYK